MKEEEQMEGEEEQKENKTKEEENEEKITEREGEGGREMKQDVWEKGEESVGERK